MGGTLYADSGFLLSSPRSPVLPDIGLVLVFSRLPPPRPSSCRERGFPEPSRRPPWVSAASSLPSAPSVSTPAASRADTVGVAAIATDGGIRRRRACRGGSRWRRTTISLREDASAPRSARSSLPGTNAEPLCGSIARSAFVERGRVAGLETRDRSRPGLWRLSRGGSSSTIISSSLRARERSRRSTASIIPCPAAFDHGHRADRGRSIGHMAESPEPSATTTTFPRSPRRHGRLGTDIAVIPSSDWKGVGILPMVWSLG